MRKYGTRILGKNVIISNDTRETGLNNNDLIIASTGLGKTGGYVVPNIQMNENSLIVSDTKNQLHRMFKDELTERGFNVLLLDFINPENSVVYNPLLFVRRTKWGGFREQDILTIATTIHPAGISAGDPLWDNLTQNFIAFCIGYCLETKPEKERNLVTVADIARNFKDIEKEDFFLDWIVDHQDTFSAKKYKEINSYSKADKMFGSVIGMVNDDLSRFSFQEAQFIFSETPEKGERAVDTEVLDISLLGMEKTVLFINQSDTESTFECMINLLYAQAFQVLCLDADRSKEGRLNVPVRIILDDFASSAKIPDFDKIISVIRSRDISVSIILQSMKQLDSMYNVSEAATIIDNCAHILYLGSMNETTQAYVASAAGKTIERIKTMPKEKAYLISFGERAKLIDKVIPYSTLGEGAKRVEEIDNTEKAAG